MGFADAYDRARRIPRPGRRNDRDRRNGAGRTFQLTNRYDQRRVNFAFGDEVGGEEYNGEYFEEDQDNIDYQRGHSHGQVNFAANGDNDSPSELELDEIDWRGTDGEVEAHLSNRSVAEEYRNAERAGDCDVFITFAKTNYRENGATQRGDRHGDSGRVWQNPGTRLKFPSGAISRERSKKIADGGQAISAETACFPHGVRLRTTKDWRSPGWETRMFRIRDADHFRIDFPS